MKCECGFEAENNFCSNCGAALKPNIFELVTKGRHQDLKKCLEEHQYDLEARDQNGNTVLIWAARNGYNSCLRLLLEHKANPNAKNNANNTAMYWAARQNYQGCLQLLLKHNADPDAKNEFGYPTLITAARNSKGCLQLLLDYGATVTPEIRAQYPLYADLWPKPNLFELVKDGKVRGLKQALQEHKYDLEARDEHGSTVLLWAAIRGYKDSLQLLLKHNVDLDVKNKYDATALSLACMHNHKDCLQLLLEYGAIASPELKEQYPRYAGLWARRYRLRFVTQKDSSAEKTIAFFCETQTIQSVKVAICERLDLEPEKVRMWDFYQRYSQKSLIEPDKSLKDEQILDGQLMYLECQREDRRPDIFELVSTGQLGKLIDALSKHTYDLEECTREKTPLTLAVCKGYQGCIGALLEKGANPNTTSGALTLLTIAVNNGLENSVEKLLTHKADPNAENGQVLFHAALKSPNCLELLLKHGAAPNITNQNGNSPLDLAFQHNKPANIQLFLEGGAKLTPSIKKSLLSTITDLQSKLPLFEALCQ